jgi:hypothetical protein
MLAAVALIVAGCGGDSSTGPKTQDLVGTWSGTTSQSKPISLTVSAQGITDVEFSFHLTGTVCSYDSNVEQGGPAVGISGGEFDWGPNQLGSAGSGAGWTLSGRFSSSTAASGSLTIGDAGCQGELTVTWTATKQ